MAQHNQLTASLLILATLYGCRERATIQTRMDGDHPGKPDGGGQHTLQDGAALDNTLNGSGTEETGITLEAGPPSCTSGAPGSLFWTRSYFDPTTHFLSAMSQLLAGHSHLIATGTLATAEGSAGWLAKLDATHEVVWQELVTPTNAECNATVLRDGGLFAGCTVTVNCPPGTNWHDCDNDVVFRRYGADDALIWEDRFSSEPNKGNDGTSGGFLETTDGDIIVPYDVSTAGSSSDPSRAHLRRYTATGAQRWDKELLLPGTGANLNLSSLVGTSDGSEVYAAGAALAQTSILKFDGDGDLKWVVGQPPDRLLYDVGMVGKRVAAVGAEKSGLERSGVVEVFSAEGESVLVKLFRATGRTPTQLRELPTGVCSWPSSVRRARSNERRPPWWKSPSRGKRFGEPLASETPSTPSRACR